jgi:hypothetical protein
MVLRLVALWAGLAFNRIPPPRPHLLQLFRSGALCDCWWVRVSDTASIYWPLLYARPLSLWKTFRILGLITGSNLLNTDILSWPFFWAVGPNWLLLVQVTPCRSQIDLPYSWSNPSWILFVLAFVYSTPWRFAFFLFCDYQKKKKKKEKEKRKEPHTVLKQ